MHPPAGLAGRLLVAAPSLLDPNFVRTVVLVLEHDAEGALGLVLNRPSPLPVGQVLPEWEECCSPPAVMALGGPVLPQGAVCLAARLPRGAAGDVARPTTSGHALVNLDGDPALLAGIPLRVFAGHAGWGPRQLDGEVEGDDWLVLDAAPADPHTPDPDELWRAVLRRQGGALAHLSTLPEDPALN